VRVEEDHATISDSVLPKSGQNYPPDGRQTLITENDPRQTKIFEQEFVRIYIGAGRIVGGFVSEQPRIIRV
jgi:hypothetical protein